MAFFVASSPRSYARNLKARRRHYDFSEAVSSGRQSLSRFPTGKLSRFAHPAVAAVWLLLRAKRPYMGHLALNERGNIDLKLKQQYLLVSKGEVKILLGAFFFSSDIFFCANSKYFPMHKFIHLICTSLIFHGIVFDRRSRAEEEKSRATVANLIRLLDV